MGYETVECVQAYLPGLGWILIPAEDGNPPVGIDDEYLYGWGPRIFNKPNTKGKMYDYRRVHDRARFELVGKHGLHDA